MIVVVTSPVPQCHVLGNLLWSLNCNWINGVGVSKWNELLFCISGFCICYLVFVNENGLCLYYRALPSRYLMESQYEFSGTFVIGPAFINLSSGKLVQIALDHPGI